MIRGWTAVFTREMLILRRRIGKLIPTWSVSPLLYLVAFSYAVGGRSMPGGRTYMEFLLPGLAAMTSMTQAFAISGEITISRHYWHIFEEFQAAPIHDAAYVLGQVLAGVTRAFLSCLVILALGAAFGVFISPGFRFWLAFMENSAFFACLAVLVAMLIKSHADQAMLSNFVILPMAFLGGTFFPVEHLPPVFRGIVLLMPLTHASGIMRAAAFGAPCHALSWWVLSLAPVPAFALAVYAVKRARD